MSPSGESPGGYAMGKDCEEHSKPNHERRHELVLLAENIANMVAASTTRRERCFLRQMVESLLESPC